MVKSTWKLVAFILHGFRDHVEIHWCQRTSRVCFPPLSSDGDENTSKEGKTDSSSHVVDYMFRFFVPFSCNQFSQPLVVPHSLRSASTKSCVNEWGEWALFHCEYSVVVFLHFLSLMIWVKSGEWFRLIRGSVGVKDTYIIKGSLKSATYTTWWDVWTCFSCWSADNDLAINREKRWFNYNVSAHLSLHFGIQISQSVALCRIWT